MSTSTRTLDVLWVCPPLAFARFGRSETPLENYRWAYNDYAPRGTAETEVVPAWTFEVADDGTISSYLPQTIRFRDDGWWRPLCPFFEVHGRWSDGAEGPLTIGDLQAVGLGLGALRWTVVAGNRKAYHYTLDPGDRVEGRLELSGGDHRKQALLGTSPSSAEHPIVPSRRSIPLGHAQVIQPTDAFPELRLRITPPKGLVYAPTNVAERDLSALVPAGIGQPEFIAELHCILAPDSAWSRWKPSGTGANTDYRTNPQLLYAQEPDETSLGFLDDSNDGHITVELSGDAVAGGRLRAHARYTCCPPDFQPDRRPFVSVADGLADAELREEVLDPGYVRGEHWAETEREIADFMQRVRETMEASNLDQQNWRCTIANANAFPDAEGNGDPEHAVPPFGPIPPRPGHPFPLTELGRANHARFLAYDVFKARMAQRPELFREWIRDPTAPPDLYDRKMPALMRGSDANPMTISQRQYELLRRWLEIVADRADGDR